jgi:hypothetical protein
VAKSVRLDALRTISRLYADERTDTTTSFITTSECNLLINQAIGEYYDELVQARGHEHFISSTDITTASGTANYSLPADFLQLLRVVVKWSTRWHEIVRDYKLPEEPRLNNFGVWGRDGMKAYRIVDQEIRFQPTPTSVETITLDYVPTFTDLVNDTDTFNFENGWEKVVCLNVAIEMRMIQDEPTTQLVARRDTQLERIRKAAEERAAAEPHRVVDVYPEGRRLNWWPTTSV